MLPTLTEVSLVSTALLADRDRDGWGDGDGKGFAFLLVLLLLGTGAFFVVRAIRQRRNGPALHGADARRLLDERFARGDIDRAEYEPRKAVLDGADVIPPAPAPPTPPAPGAASGTTATMEAPTTAGGFDPASAGDDASPADGDEAPDGGGSSDGEESS